MKKEKILIADDNESFLYLLKDFLISNGYQVATSINGEEALRDFADIAPDIVITDIVMPNVDGLELLLELRKLNPQIKIIVMSGGNRGHADTYLQTANKLGANTILYKPFQLSDLLSEVEKIKALG